MLQPGVRFDPAKFWALALDRLPRYAAPIYLRIAPTTDMTGNYKLRKVDLQRQGYDTTLVDDPLYIRDDKLKTYVPLNPALARAVG